MTKRDFLRLLIKFIALNLLITCLYTLITQVSYAINFNNLNTNILLAISMIPPLILFWVLITGSDKIISFLKLDKHFDDDHIIIGNMNLKGIYATVIIFIGAYLFVDHIADFIYQSILVFKDTISKQNPISTSHIPLKPMNYQTWITSGICITIGYLMLTNAKRLGGWLHKNND
ncbi:hypothetical protein [Neptunitalea lumnitzerae]|uniref:Uncharacterized protein n=1 Tax=Neptunitalea lumnitzerae TaxID=2965509 RepID=A0ABQ5MEV4_9FLAO|nr:hypothetical protein [Neptunitalea sp. Y10]GLB47924.1 hypothetical protein Y10_02920 [Neptunitalea sp. Y10]